MKNLKLKLEKIRELLLIPFIFCVLFVFSIGSSIDNQSNSSDNEHPKNQNLDNKRAKVGVYFFNGWSGQNSHANDPNEPWAKDAPEHLTRRMLEEFPGREPVWGWRSDSQEIVEMQIDLAANHGIDIFIFCWYWMGNSDGKMNADAIENLSLHTQMNMYFKAKNKNKIQFALVVANHGNNTIKTPAQWEEATHYWMKYFKDPQHLSVDGKPLIVIFNPSGINEESMNRMQNVAKQNGFPGLSIAGCNNPRAKGFTHRTNYNKIGDYNIGGLKRTYEELVDVNKAQWFGTEELPYIPVLTVGFDRRPWEGPTGIYNNPPIYYFTGRTPEKFESYLEDAITWMDEHPEQTTKERIILLYAWNEIGEGGYLMPTKGDPEGEYIKVIQKVVTDQK